METTPLVIGATGNVGRHVVAELRSRDVPVRAFVRDPDRAATVLGGDVELAVGDLADPGSIARALEGVERVFLSCGNVPGQVEFEGNAIDAARAAGVELIVKLSTSSASVDSPLLFPQWQGQIERHLERSGVPAVLLHPHDYMTNMLAFADTIRATGKILAPLSGAKTAMIDPRDVGAAAAAVLTEDGHEGRTYVLTGPEAVTYDQIASHLSEATGRHIEFVDTPEEACREAMLGKGMPDFIVDFVIALYGEMRNGIAAETTDTVTTLTGRAPRSVAEFARDHADAFRA